MNKNKRISVNFEINGELPRYKHDCGNCIFLGSYNEYDLYYCDTDPTVIGRYSSIPSEYKSGLNFGIHGLYIEEDRDDCLTEALRRAIRFGLCEIEIKNIK